MKFNRKFIALILTLIMVINLPIIGSIPIFAHELMLNVSYDDCIGAVASDSVDEEWYTITATTINYHISHEVDTIKYYFEVNPESEGDTEEEKFDWTDLSEEFAQEIKTAVVNSMKKWDNIYFYSYNLDGSITKNKVINIVEGTKQDHNLSIFPETGTKRMGAAYWGGEKNTLESGTVTHAHFSEWYIWVNIDYFDEDKYARSIVNMVKERLGAHEFGHALGLFDVDNCCSATNTDVAHHDELLMGYGSNRSTNITYKDIAGVAITRGFHTDDDHRWLNMGQQSDGTYKLVCTICNGVKYVTSLSGYSYNTYGSCGNEHELSDGNMMAVASYGNKDYFKCKYCRYVAPFSEIVTQDYSIQSVSNYRHKFESNNGLEYFFYEDHTIVDNVCTKCGASHTHEYNTCVYMNKLSHKMVCACGAIGSISAHYVVGGPAPGQTSAPCGGCGCDLDLLHNGQVGIMSATQVSINGSYILPNGIVVLVEEDVEAYLAGTLQFYHPEDVPVTQ